MEVGKAPSSITAGSPARPRGSSLSLPLPAPTEYKGGEGVLLLNASSRGYWVETLFAWHGRPMPAVPIFVYATWAVSATTLCMLYPDPVSPLDRDDAGSDNPAPRFVLDTTVESLVGAALFFLLVFRTNTCYDRWWEARKQWGLIINRTRDFSRQGAAYVRSHARVATLMKYSVAYAVCAKQHLRGDRNLAELAVYLSRGEVEEIEQSKHVVLRVLRTLSETLAGAHAAGEIDSIQLSMLDANLTTLEDTLGACERILKTKMPFGYIVHLRAFLVLWTAALPFALVPFLLWGTPVACIVIFYALLGIDAIGVEVENPFGRDYNDLPLDSIVHDTIAANVVGEMLPWAMAQPVRLAPSPPPQGPRDSVSPASVRVGLERRAVGAHLAPPPHPALPPDASSATAEGKG
mmetsp:Transcript_5374/g.14759  ORF Transcript_5374/g.14759 Transcript_5374/m.14759 type:complete len:406 (-) Transcript_5374:567-1784(-)